MNRAFVVSNTVIAHETREVVLRTNQPFSFTPGQYITILVPLADGKSVGRSYSLASLPGTDTFTIVIKLVEGGVASAYIQSLKNGDQISFVGPMGKLGLSALSQDFLFVATGMGVSPFLSMIPSLFSVSQQHATLLLGFRHEEDIAYEETFRQWEKEHPNFRFILTLSRPSDAWTGEKGRVTEHLVQHKDILSNKQVYICGNGSMVRDVEQICLENGIPKDHIFFEKYNNL